VNTLKEAPGVSIQLSALKEEELREPQFIEPLKVHG
jgi:hypothetical protein